MLKYHCRWRNISAVKKMFEYTLFAGNKYVYKIRKLRETGMSENKVLVLEDDGNLGFILKEHLEMNDFTVTLVQNGADGLKEYEKTSYQLLLADIMMPKMDGFAFVKAIRERDHEVPVIFLTSKSLKEDRIEGFKAGCDDYVTKPFSMEELLLRIQAVLRRTNKSGEARLTENQFWIGKYFFDYNRQLLHFKGTKESLTSKESELLRLLCLNMNKTLVREEALKTVWGDDSYFNARSMDVFISRLRKYLKEDASVTLTNIHGRGYKLTTDI